MNILEAIATRERQLAEWRPRKELEDELAQLEAAALIGELARPRGETRMKPPPRGRKVPAPGREPSVRKEKPVRAEKAPAAPRACKGCMKPIPPRANGQPGRQKQWHPECLAASKRSPKTKAEPDPVLAHAAAFFPALLKEQTPAQQKPTPFAKVAAAWAGQCPMLDSDTGKRCSLPARHDGLHSAGGRQFSNAGATTAPMGQEAIA